MEASREQNRVAAFFDMDLTIAKLDSFRYFLKRQYLKRSKNWHFSFEVLFWGILKKFGFISLKTFKEKSLVSLVGMTESSILELGGDFFRKHLLSSAIRTQAKERIKWHKQKGHLVYIASSLPDIYVNPIAQYLECDGYVCSKLAYQDNKFVGRFNGEDCLGSEKVERLRQIADQFGIDLRESFAYSDHESDLPLLEWVGNPIVISPTVVLRKIAEERNWKIEVW